MRAHPPLHWFEFDVATIESGGRLQKRRRRAQSYIEDLGSQGFMRDQVTLEMVVIPGGTFWMGAHPTDIEWAGGCLPQWIIEEVIREKGTRERLLDNETPRHEVTVAPFFMGKFPVTQAQWRQVASLPQVNCPLEPNPTERVSPNLRDKSRGSSAKPVLVSSWDEIEEFCARLSRKAGRIYRLPSESEWEYACRAGTTTMFHFGNTITPTLANYKAELFHTPPGILTALDEIKYGRGTEPVGSFKVANTFGLYDMHGNTYELCADLWHESYQGAPTDGFGR